MKDEILKAADEIAVVFNETPEWLAPKRSAIVKILKRLNSRGSRIKKIEGKENKSNKRLLKLLIDYFDLSQDNFFQARRGNTPDWGEVQKIANKVEDDFNLESIKGYL